MNSATDIQRFEGRVLQMKTLASSSSSGKVLKRSLPSSTSVTTLEQEEDADFVRKNLIEKINDTMDSLRPSKKSKYNAVAVKIVSSDIFDFLTFDLPNEEKKTIESHVPFKDPGVDIIGLSLKSDKFWIDIMKMELDSTVV